MSEQFQLQNISDPFTGLKVPRKGLCGPVSATSSKPTIPAHPLPPALFPFLSPSPFLSLKHAHTNLVMHTATLLPSKSNQITLLKVVTWETLETLKTVLQENNPRDGKENNIEQDK